MDVWLLFSFTYAAQLPKDIQFVPVDPYGTKLVHQMLVQEDCKFYAAK